MRSLPALLVATSFGACGTGDGSRDALPITTFVEVQLHHGLDSKWTASAAGRVGEAPWQRRGPRPELGACLAWRFTTEGKEVVLAQRPRLVVAGIGDYNLVQFQGGDIELDGGNAVLPTAPFLSVGDPIDLVLDDARQVRATTPPWPELVGPAPNSLCNLRSPMRFDWRTQGEPYVLLSLALFTDGFAFRGALNCKVPDTGSFEIPAIVQELPNDISRAVLHLESERMNRLVYDQTQVDLFVRQFSIRDYLASPN